MSYTSESVLKPGTSLSQVRELVSLLGYRKVTDGLVVPGRTDSFFWFEEKDYRSFVGVELDIYRGARNRITVGTRSRISRSYWDLTHQNRTLKLLRDFFGGHFRSDAGRNRYWRPDRKPPTPLASGCFIARWRFNNALMRAKIYLDFRELKGDISKDKPSGFGFVDEMNPRLLSNNLLIPYVVAVWEDYFKSTFTAAFRYSTQRELALKRARLTHDQLEQIAAGSRSIERAVAETFTFQRPSAVAEYFKLLDPKLDIAGALRKPYRRRRISLYNSLESLVEGRHEFVHTGTINTGLFDAQLKKSLSDIEIAVDRAYEHIASHYGFTTCYEF